MRNHEIIRYELPDYLGVSIFFLNLYQQHSIPWSWGYLTGHNLGQDKVNTMGEILQPSHLTV